MAALGELTGSLWAFIRSDPSSIRQLNTAGQWSTWQATRQHGPRPERAPKPLSGRGSDRRSVRRLRSLDL
jgi:hypothetical protein